MLDYRLTANDRAALVRLHLKAYQEAIDIAPAVIEVIKRFDGKQANKRIDTALKEINPNLKFSSEYSWAEIEMYIENRYYRGDGYAAGYVSSSTVQIVHACNYTGEKAHLSPVIDGKLNAAVVVEGIEIYVEQHKSLIETVTEQLQRVDEMRIERERIIKESQAFNSALSWMIDDYFELRIK
jgi:hypothetical protein